MAGIDVVVTDLDGTLWDAGQRVHHRTEAALGELERRGVPLLVATGRRRRTAAAALAQIGLAPPAVVLDGAMGLDLDTGRRFHDHGFSPEQAVLVLAAFAEAGLSPCVYVDAPRAEVLVGESPSTCEAHVRFVGEWLCRTDLVQAIVQTPVYALAVYGAADHRRLHECAALVNASGAGVASVFRDVMFSGAGILARPEGVSKWEGVLAFCVEQGLDSGRVLAVGDGENDLELLTGAAVSCVVSDGCEAALALADHVLDPADQGGWGHVLELV